jgi:hypothetical protein
MNEDIAKIKRETEAKFSELRLKRKSIATKFKKKLEEEKINQIKNSILDK